MKRLCLILMFGLLASGSAGAADGDCKSFKWPIAREQALFSTAAAAGSGAALMLDSAVSLTLKPVGQLGFKAEPERKPADGTYGAVMDLMIPEDGTVQITLSDEAWVDVIQNDKTTRSAGFSGAKDCPGIRKSVRFKVSAGDATIQISGARVEAMKVAVLPASGE